MKRNRWDKSVYFLNSISAEEEERALNLVIVLAVSQYW
jgi:hypothetical protein